MFFFSRSPESSSRPNGSPRLVDFWQVNPANISEHERWRWDMWKKLLKGIPPCDFASKWRRTGVGIWELGSQQNLEKVGKSKSKSTDRNELMPCVVWLACWKWWKTCESGKPCTSLRGFLWNHRQLHPFQHSTWVLVWEVFKMPVQTGMNEGLKKISRRLPRAFSGVSFFLYKPNCHQIQTYGFLEQVQVMIYFSHKLIRISFPKTGWREVVSKSLLRCRGSSSII